MRAQTEDREYSVDSEQMLKMDVTSRRAVSVGAQLQRREAIIAGVRSKVDSLLLSHWGSPTVITNPQKYRVFFTSMWGSLYLKQVYFAYGHRYTCVYLGRGGLWDNGENPSLPNPDEKADAHRNECFAVSKPFPVTHILLSWRLENVKEEKEEG
ncbi:hypothetical protein MJT46_004978 [Ovis ammon polii x Ovis aries]|nr:hypothetical protein MJT46_004978 [Ovis ammon polii x Ovis aries]